MGVADLSLEVVDFLLPAQQLVLVGARLGELSSGGGRDFGLPEEHLLEFGQTFELAKAGVRDLST